MCIQMLRVVLTCAVAVGAGSVYADAACVVDAFDAVAVTDGVLLLRFLLH